MNLEAVDNDMNKEDLAYELAILPRKYIIRENSHFKFWWQIFIMSIAVIASTLYTYLFAFTKSQGFEIESLLISCAYLLDIFVNFTSSYVDDITGDEIFSPAMIAKRYIFSKYFFIDLIAMIPFNYFHIGYDPYGSIAELMIGAKIFRIGNISEIISNLNMKDTVKAKLKVLNLICMLLIFIHLYACIMWFIFDIN
jgi:hypothetical protein